MKYIITERQLSLIKEENILKIDFEFFNWGSLQKFLKRRKNPPYIIKGNLDLFSSEIESLGNLQSVGGFLDLGYCKNFTKLGKLKSVGGYLDLTKTNIESLGNLQSVGGNLYLMDTPLSEKTTEEEIRNTPGLTIKGNIYL